MNFYCLEIFYHVAKEKSFTKASHKMFITQSAVSLQMKKFEEELGTKLFKKEGKKISLTYPGEFLLKYATDIFDHTKQVEKELRRIITNDQWKISIGATYLVGEPMLPEILKRFSKKYANFQFEVFVQDIDTLLGYLHEGKIDIMLLGDYYEDDKHLMYIPLDKFPFVLVAASDIKTFDDLSTLPLLTRNDSPTLDKKIHFFEENHDLSIKKRIIINGSAEVLKQFIIEGFGFAILPSFFVYNEVKNNELNILADTSEFSMEYQAIIMKENDNRHELRKFVDFLKDFKINSIT